jgi:predicted Zn-dependent protease
MRQLMLPNIDKYFALVKFIILALLLITPICSSANEYSVESIINLEQRLYILKSEIHIAKGSTPDSNKNQNPALYHIKKKSWEKSYKSISPDEAASTSENKHYTNILYGITLQGLNKNKEAFNYYNKVPHGSSHYATAQLNIALLYMHDGLTNKSFNTINKILTDPSVILNRQIKNRLFLILGYLYFKENKYHEARKTFRNIETKSIYSNRALIGIALAALQLKDYTASQHILSLLNNER